MHKHFPSYDDNSISASDDFQRMFLSRGDGCEKRRKRRGEREEWAGAVTTMKRQRNSSLRTDEGGSADEDDDEEAEEETEEENDETEEQEPRNGKYLDGPAGQVSGIAGYFRGNGIKG